MMESTMIGGMLMLVATGLPPAAGIVNAFGILTVQRVMRKGHHGLTSIEGWL